MFRCRTAWFSKSVNEARIKFWVQEGGTITGWRKADFIFSEDATSSDTLRIYESKDFLWDKVTVFHSVFLLTCEIRQSVTSISIGHYVLPPVSVQHEVRKVIGRMIWECESDPLVTQENSVSTKCLDDESGEEVSLSNCESSDEDSIPEWEDHLRNKAKGTLTGYNFFRAALDHYRLRVGLSPITESDQPQPNITGATNMGSNIGDIQPNSFEPDSSWDEEKTKTHMDLYFFKWMHQNGAEQGACSQTSSFSNSMFSSTPGFRQELSSSVLDDLQQFVLFCHR